MQASTVSDTLIDDLRFELRHSRVIAARETEKATALARVLRLYVGADDPDVADQAVAEHTSQSSRPAITSRRQTRVLPSGISYGTGGVTFRARPYRHGHRIELGSFPTLTAAVDAIAAYDEARKRKLINPPRVRPTPELPASDGAKGEAPASLPTLGVSSLDSPAVSSEPPAFSEDDPLRPRTKDRVLDLYASSTLSAREIAEQLDCPAGSASAFISMGRGDGDQRVMDGDARRGRQPVAAKVVDVPEGDRRVPRFDASNLPTAGAAQPKVIRRQAEVGPALARKAAPGHLDLVPVGPIAVDEKAGVIAGPKGEWVTTVPCVRAIKILAALQPGTFADANLLCQRVPMPKPRLLESIPSWARQLAEIGVKLNTYGRDNFYLTLEGAA